MYYSCSYSYWTLTNYCTIYKTAVACIKINIKTTSTTNSYTDIAIAIYVDAV